MFINDLFENFTAVDQIRQQGFDDSVRPQHTSPDERMYVEDAQLQVVVLYPGRFQPFHLGHADVFRSLQERFGREHVYIATSNKTDAVKSPFNFSNKTVFMTAAGVPLDRILEVVSPYKLPAQFDPTNTIFIVAVGAPDAQRLGTDGIKKDGSASYFKSFKSLDDSGSADQHGYCIVAEERLKTVTIGGQGYDASHGTQARALWNQVRNDPQGRAEYLVQMYGRNDPEVGRVLDKIPTVTAEGQSPELGRGSVQEHIVKHGKEFRLLSKKGKNLGTFPTHHAAAQHEGEVGYFKSQAKESQVFESYMNHLFRDTK
jgi:cytidyltransferase-like protein